MGSELSVARQHTPSVHYLEFTTTENSQRPASDTTLLPTADTASVDDPSSNHLPPSPPPLRIPMSLDEWKRQPTVSQVVFGLALPYKPPHGSFGAFLWRRRVWLETTFALSMMQPWEKVVVVCAASFFLALLLVGMYLYLPHHFVYLHGRALYYLWGHEASVGKSLHAAWTWSSSWRAVANWSNPAALSASLHEGL
ncbi:uncharacterized protein FIBRA_03304 [Fibroporia radiculosa]|uniref:Uncharacterized protein n=1 Tax=Fibroporia radiculosa TaxID=599839 RepID=J4GNE6_9APHY|nr:uncharacterized protein FIBRA_03304 [Fibroporia radiculosa]CCM01255.1 predicted protein [Fibroporia radiculosa]